MQKFDALAHPQRLAVFRLLMRRYPDALCAGEIAEALALNASTLSRYLSALMRAGLVTQNRRGTSLHYSIAMADVQGMVEYLALDCCRGRPELCLPQSGQPRQPDAPLEVLFLCTGNSARSILAEVLLRDLGAGRFNVHSAGTRPFSELNPVVLTMLYEKGHKISGLRPKHLSHFQRGDAPAFDFVLTVCDDAANTDCPLWAGAPVSAHWGLPDPVTAPRNRRAWAFEQAYSALHRLITDLVALPLEQMDRTQRQGAVDAIARSRMELLK